MQEKIYKKYLTMWVIITIVLVGVSFYAGDKHGGSAVSALRGQYGANGTHTAGRFAAGTGLVTGSVTSKDATSLTVKSRDGSSKIVLYSGTTEVLESTSGTTDDVTVGSQVSVQGTQNTDGSVTAQSIQIRPNIPAQTPPTTSPSQPSAQ